MTGENMKDGNMVGLSLSYLPIVCFSFPLYCLLLTFLPLNVEENRRKIQESTKK